MAILGSTDLGDGLLALTIDHDPLSTPTDAPAGSLLIDSSGNWHRKIDSGSTTNATEATARKDNLTAATDPTVGDDTGDGYARGSLWFNQSLVKNFICTDPTLGAAVWKLQLISISQDPAPQLGGSLNVNGQTINSISNGAIAIQPHGTGALNLATTGTGITTIGNSTGLVLLGGNLDVNGKTITSASSGNVNVIPNGAGVLNLATSNTGQLLLGNSTGLIVIYNNLLFNTSGHGLKDINGKYFLSFTSVPSAVNYLTVSNSITANRPIIQAAGTDSDVGITFSPKGAGKLVFSGQQWPAADGSSGQILTTDGSGVLSWVTPSAALPKGHLYAAAITWSSTSTVALGLSGVTAKARSSDDTYDISWSGTLTVSLALSGAGGLDTGSEAANTWYAAFVIADSTAVNTPKGLFSLSATAPTMPSGYNKFRRLGWVRNNATSDIRRFFTYSLLGSSRRYLFDDGGVEVLTAGNSVTYVDVSCSSAIPTTADLGIFLIAVSVNNGNRAGFVRPGDFTYAPGTAQDEPYHWYNGGAQVRKIPYIMIPVNSSQQVSYKVENTADNVTIKVLGFVDPL